MFSSLRKFENDSCSYYIFAWHTTYVVCFVCRNGTLLSRVILEGVVCHPSLNRPAKQLAGLAMWRYVCEKPGRPPLRYGGRPTSRFAAVAGNFKLKLVLQ